MHHADGFEVALVRNDKDYKEKNVSQGQMKQLLRGRKGDEFDDDRLPANHAAVHRQIRDDADEPVKVAFRFDAKQFNLFTGDILQVTIVVDKSTHTHHFGEPTGGFLRPLILGMAGSDKDISMPFGKARSVLSAGLSTSTRGFKAGPGTIAVFVARGKFASDRKSRNKDLGFTPIASKNGHTYAFQFQCLPKGSPIAAGPVPKSSRALTNVKSRATTMSSTGMPLRLGAAPHISTAARVGRSSGMPLSAAHNMNTATPGSRPPQGASQMTLALPVTKRKASMESSASWAPATDDGSMSKTQKLSVEAGLTDKQAFNLTVPAPVQPQATPNRQVAYRAIPRRALQDSDAGKQPRVLIDLTLDDSADEDDIPLKLVLARQKVAKQDPVKPGMAEKEDEEDEDAEDLVLELREVQLQRKLKAMRKKSRQANVEGIKQESL